jgi:hypothetical protein
MVFSIVVDDEEVSSECKSNHNDYRYTNTEANVMRTTVDSGAKNRTGAEPNQA